MGVYAYYCFLFSLFIILHLHIVWTSSALIPNASSLEYHQSLPNNSSHSTASVFQLQQHNKVLVNPQGGGGGGGGGGEEKRTAASWFVLRSKGGRSGGLGGSNINHRPAKQNQKNAASSLFVNSNWFAANSLGFILFVLVLIFLMRF